MPLNAARIRALLKSADFTTLFIEELGWDRHAARVDLDFSGTPYRLDAIAEKRGFAAFTCSPAPDGRLPDYATRGKIERQLAKSFHEHIIIFVDKEKSVQIWQWVKREIGSAAARREHPYYAGQSADSLIQKLSRLTYSLADEEAASLAGHVERVRGAFDVEKVTKRFYDLFQKERDKFETFIAGLEGVEDRKWYTSVMLNRLMFVYFVQKKGFLDGDRNYLRNRLGKLRTQNSGDKFYSFYRYFLLRLFHEGLGASKRSPVLDALIGKIPYLNGGIFDIHPLEEANSKIAIPDEAFERIFGFFDQWEWHLDYRPDAKGNEINPEVIGYIFEKYINQKQMGAYYTKEDITDYISKNCVIPFLFDAVRAQQESAFVGPNSVWRLLQDDPDEYIYEAVRKGCDKKLPPEIAEGIDPNTPNLLERRKAWNKSADPEYALPTEIWREVVARRQRYEEVRGKLAAGEVTSINDLITYNLDIRRFAENVIGGCDDPELLRKFWQALQKMSVLDPTCGSGAFLFAALNVLQPLYEKCLERMEWFVGQADRNGQPTQHADFRAVLAHIHAHPNEDYFVIKSIIVNNLYGVDIMEEAVEICKLRLFLKLAAQVETADQIEPLPDIDFNIRAGNTLVGFASLDEVKKTVAGKLTDDSTNKEIAEIEEEARNCAAYFAKFRERQTEMCPGTDTGAKIKKELRKYLEALNDKLNHYLAAEYGVRPAQKTEYFGWLHSHQPFHWLSEFYEVIISGGFDVIIGNPPYVEYGAKLKAQYTVHGYATIDCGNLHAYICERCLDSVAVIGRVGLIVPLPAINTSRMETLQTLIKPSSEGVQSRDLFVAAFDERPSNLFSGVDQRLVIEIIGAISKRATLQTTGINRWASATRPSLFKSLHFTKQLYDISQLSHGVLKLKDSSIETPMLEKFQRNQTIANYRAVSRTRELLAYRTAGGRYWKIVLDEPFESESLSNKVAHLIGLTGQQAAALVSSSTFWWYYSCFFGLIRLTRTSLCAMRISSI